MTGPNTGKELCSSSQWCGGRGELGGSQGGQLLDLRSPRGHTKDLGFVLRLERS